MISYHNFVMFVGPLLANSGQFDGRFPKAFAFIQPAVGKERDLSFVRYKAAMQASPRGFRFDDV